MIDSLEALSVYPPPHHFIEGHVSVEAAGYIVHAIITDGVGVREPMTWIPEWPYQSEAAAKESLAQFASDNGYRLEWRELTT